MTATAVRAATIAVVGLTLAPGVSGAGNHAAKIVIGQRYARCSDPHPKTYTTCPDVATKEGHVLSLQFMVKKTRCASIKPETPGVWSYVSTLTVRHGKVSGKLDYNNYVAGSQGTDDDIGISFRWSGKFVSSKRLHLVLNGHVTKLGSAAAIQDCKGLSFTETHDLRTVNF